MLIKYFNDRYNKDILIKIFTQDQIDYFIKDAIRFKDKPKKDFYDFITYNKKEPKEIKHVSKRNSEIDWEIISNLVKNKSIFILSENDKNELEYTNIYFGKNNIEIKNLFKNKILGHIENTKSFKIIMDKEKFEYADEKEKEEKNKLLFDYEKLCSFAFKFKKNIMKKKKDKKNEIKDDIIIYNNIKNKHFYCEEYFNDEIGLEESDSNQDECTITSIKSKKYIKKEIINLVKKLIYKETIQKDINSMKKVKNEKNEVAIILLNKSNELLFFDETLEDIHYKFMSIFYYTNNKIGKHSNLKEIQRMVLTNPNNCKFKVNCVCQLLLIKENNIEKTNYFYFGGSQENKGKIKLYQLDNGKYEYIQDIDIIKGNNNNIIPPIKSIEQSHKNGKILILYLDGNVDVFETPFIISY